LMFAAVLYVLSVPLPLMLVAGFGSEVPLSVGMPLMKTMERRSANV